METINKINTKDINRVWGTQISLAFALIGLCVIFSFSTGHFLSVNNFVNIGHYLPPFAIMAAGCTVAMLIGALDVSQYSICALTGVLGVFLNRAGVPIGGVFVLCILFGFMLGTLNGTIITVLRINPIIGTLASGMIMRGFCYMGTSGKTLSIGSETSDLYFSVGRGTLFGVIPYTLLIMAGVYALIFITLKHTGFGRKIYVVGGNSRAAFLAGINVRSVRMGAMMLCGATAGLAGFIILAQLGAFQPNTGEATLMDVIAAVILGGLSLAGGKGKLSGTFLGVMILTVIQNGMNLMGVQSFYQQIVRGIIVICAVFLDVLRGGEYK